MYARASGWFEAARSRLASATGRRERKSGKRREWLGPGRKPTNQVLRKGEGREWPSAALGASLFERLATLGQGPAAPAGPPGRGRGRVKNLALCRICRTESKEQRRRHQKENGSKSLKGYRFEPRLDQMSTCLLFRRRSAGRAFSGSRRRTGAAGRSSTSTGSPRPGTAWTSE